MSVPRQKKWQFHSIGQKFTRRKVIVLYTRPLVLNFESLQLPKPTTTSNFKLKNIIDLSRTENKEKGSYKSFTNLLDYK